ncbi:MAG: DUF7133 domain-containing protein, partial [Opitutaceae bacterium]
MRLRASFFLVGVSAVFAQLGDLPNDVPQKPLFPLPPPPVFLSAAEQQRTFRLAPGFQIELVADETLVHDPVAVAFDLDGNLWVAEMTGLNREMPRFLPALTDGLTELPPGKIVKLESSRGDGRFDRRTVFLDGLDAPRALAILRDGVLVADPPYLWLVRDTDGDGRGDEKTVVSDAYGRKGDDESSANGLVWGRDNFIHSSAHDEAIRLRQGRWEHVTVPKRGQWGLTQDDCGRFFFTRNIGQTRADLFSPYYARRNPHVTDLPWMNALPHDHLIVWPRHPTPSGNRGYRLGQPGTSNKGLRRDGSLLEFTSAGGTALYRGANFPPAFYNNAFTPDPVGNLIKRSVLLETEGRISVVNAYEGREFLTSTDERFRPVTIANAPDGSLIVVDLYRGMIVDYPVLSSYLKDQLLNRRLNRPFFGTGRIWRITYTAGPLEKQRPDLLHRNGEKLAELLSHPNAWWRDTAQQALVEREDRTAVPYLERMALTAEQDITRVYALWTLD